MFAAEKVAVVSKQKTKTKKKKKKEDEAAFLATYKLEDFPRPSVAVDVVILTVNDGALFVCLYERKDHPAKETFALPGGFVRIDESLDDAARRIVREKAGLDDVFLEQLYTFGDPGRDPRGRVITVAHVALIEAARFHTSSAPKGRIEVPWPGETGGPVDVLVDDDDDDDDDANREHTDLAFDHKDILGTAVKRLRGKLDYTPIGFQLLPAEFTLRALQDVHEAVRGEQVNKDSFRRRMLASGHIEATGSHERGVTWRPAELYRFIRRSAV
jgi:8-oxo-dGTP diphosphatase